jgi:hypothetical protein
MEPAPEFRAYEGLGPIRLGMRPNEVKTILGRTLTWEPWMGGNLNDCLYYPGIILYFDKYNGVGPLEDAQLIEIEINSQYPALWKGVRIGSLTPDRASQLLPENKCTTYPNGKTVVAGSGVQFWFDDQKILQGIRLGTGNGA